jgi:hypothetical protein
MMEVIFHTAKESGKYWREFAEKRADFVLRELRDYRANDLKALLRIVREENRTFEQSA